jgi:hypothetical protein
MRVNLEPETDLLQHGVRLVLARLTGLHVCFVLVLAEVHKLADRRPCLRGDLYKVEVSLLGETQRVFNPDDADLLPVGADQPHLWDADPVVNPGLADVVLLHAVSRTAGAREKAPERERARISLSDQHGKSSTVRTPPRGRGGPEPGD